MALAVGLGIGLAFTLIAALIFCVKFYRMKHRYEELLHEEGISIKVSNNNDMIELSSDFRNNNEQEHRKIRNYLSNIH